MSREEVVGYALLGVLLTALGLVLWAIRGIIGR